MQFTPFLFKRTLSAYHFIKVSVSQEYIPIQYRNSYVLTKLVPSYVCQVDLLFIPWKRDVQIRNAEGF